MERLRFRFFWGVMIAAGCLAALCAVIAVYLFQEQALFNHGFSENVASRKAAVEMEECIAGLVAQEEEQVEAVSALHTRAKTHLAELAQHTDEPQEKELYAKMEAGWENYLRLWAALPALGTPTRNRARAEATELLTEHVLKPCQQFRLFNGEQLEEAAGRHEEVLRRLGLGMALIGGLGGIAGIVLGFGVARTLTLSIRRLQVQIRDAAGKLGPHLPQIVFTPSGDFRGLHAQVNHLTGRIEEVVAALQQREREVLRAEQLSAVGQLAAGVAHEVRNPLTSIKMLVQLALEQRTSVPPDDLQVIDGEIRKMENSLRAFLDFARPPKAERRSVDLLSIVAAVIGLIRGRTEKQNVALRVYDPGRPVVVTADPDQIRQVLVNLALNALDAMPTGGVLQLVVRDSLDGVEVEITDTGAGIAAEVAPKLFQPFVSGKDTGLGLGLVISQRIAEDHGGRLIGANAEGVGATFTLTLPK